MLRRDIIDVIGERVAGEADHYRAYFHACPACGQPVDRRDLAALLHHEQPGHEPLPLEQAYRLAIVNEQIDRALPEHSASPKRSRP